MKFIYTLLFLFSSASLLMAGEITINGKGESKETPDQAVVAFTVATKSSKIADAIEGNSKYMRIAFDDLETNFKVDKKSLKTIQFGIKPVYEKVEDKQKLTGYVCANRAAVTTTAPKLVEMLTSLSKKENVRIEALYFIASDDLKKKMLAKARELAMKDAMEKAKLYADAAKVTLGKVKSVLEGYEETPYVQDHIGEAAIKTVQESTVPISEGELKVTASVRVIFDLESPSK